MAVAEVSQSARSKRSEFKSGTYGLADTAKLLGVSYGVLREMVKSGTAPVDSIRLGRQVKFPKSRVHALLGIEPDDARDDITT